MYSHYRRVLARTDESEIAATDLLIQNAAVAQKSAEGMGMYDLSQNENYFDSAQSTNVSLKQHLSIRSIVSAATSDSIRDQDAVEDNALRGYVSIGTGFCGEIFHMLGTGRVLKRPHPNQREILNDAKVHSAVYEAIRSAQFARPSLVIQVPQLFDMHGARDEKWWAQNRSKFPATAKKEPTDVIITERVLPLPAQVRTKLIDLFCPNGLKPAAHAATENKNCLMRMYLGRRRRAFSLSATLDQWHGLRNFEADLSILDTLEIDTLDHAESMGIALASMHFDACTDARDVEFVLGTAPASSSSAASVHHPELSRRDWCLVAQGTDINLIRSFKQRLVRLWVIDFDQCRDIALTRAGMDQAVRAFQQNEPYYPRPVGVGDRDRPLWDVFVAGYVGRAERLGFGVLGRYFCERLVEGQVASFGSAGGSGNGNGGPPRDRDRVVLARREDGVEVGKGMGAMGVGRQFCG